jgi:CHAD domain-containing protein
MAKAPRYDGLTPETTPADAAGAILEPLLAAALREAPAVLREQDVRATHDMRVALRRLRSALETFAACFPAKRVKARTRALRRLARRLGEVRDADVHLAELRAALAGATANETTGITYAIETLVAARRAALARVAIELSQFDRAAPLGAAAGGGSKTASSLRTFSRHTIRKRLRAALHSAKAAFPKGSAAELHALRKDLKNLRYNLEFFTTLFGSAGSEALDLLGGVQERLGTIADADAFAATYAALLAGLGPADPRLPGLAACRSAARARRRKVLAGLRKLWSGDDADAYPGRLAASISSALGSLSPKPEA